MGFISDWLDRRSGWDGGRTPGTPTVFPARLESSLEGAFFQAKVTLDWWGSTPPIGYVAQLQQERLRPAMGKAAGEYSVLYPGEATSAVNAALADAVGDLDIAVEAHAVLTPEPEGEELTRQHEEVLRQGTLARSRRQAQLAELSFLAEWILPDPTLAMTWWLNDDPNRIPELARRKADFEKAAELLTAGSAATRDPIPDLLRRFLDGLGPRHRALLLHRLGEIFIGYERPDLAQEIDLPDLPPPPVNGARPAGEDPPPVTPRDGGRS